MNLAEPCIFKLYFYAELKDCVNAVEKIKDTFNLKIMDAQLTETPEELLKDFLEILDKKTGNNTLDLYDTRCIYVYNEIYKLAVKYYRKEKGSAGIFIVVTALNSHEPDVMQGWEKLEEGYPRNIPDGLLKPITVYYAISDRVVTRHDFTSAEIKLSDFNELRGKEINLRYTSLVFGELFKLWDSEESKEYFIFSRNERGKEAEVNCFATIVLPLLNIYLYSGNVEIKNKGINLDKIKGDMKEVTEMVENRLAAFAKMGKRLDLSMLEERWGDVLNITKYLHSFNIIANLLLSIIESVDIVLYKYRYLKEKLISPTQTDEIFSYDEESLEIQKTQLKAYASYLRNTYESGRALLNAIEDLVSIEYTRELKESNKKHLSLKYAALLIEFVVVFYYTLGIWEKILGHGYEKFHAGLRFIFAGSIAGMFCAATHVLAEMYYSKKEHHSNSILCLLYLIVGFLIILGCIVYKAFFV